MNLVKESTQRSLRSPRVSSLRAVPLLHCPAEHRGIQSDDKLRPICGTLRRRVEQADRRATRPAVL